MFYIRKTIAKDSCVYRIGNGISLTYHTKYLLSHNAQPRARFEHIFEHDQFVNYDVLGISIIYVCFFVKISTFSYTFSKISF
jgi:hypothetical protein